MNRQQDEDFAHRKDFFRKKHISNKHLNKKNTKNLEDDFSSKKINKANKRKIEDLRQEELWEDWQEFDDE